MHKPVKATVGAVIEGPGGVLPALRNHPPFEGFWRLPGGHIEFGEELGETELAFMHGDVVRRYLEG